MAARPGRHRAWFINEATTILPKNLSWSTPRTDFSTGQHAVQPQTPIEREIRSKVHDPVEPDGFKKVDGSRWSHFGIISDASARKLVVGLEPFKKPGPQRMRAWQPFAWTQWRTAKAQPRASGIYHASYAIMSVPTPEPIENDWVRRVLFEQGFLAKIPGDAIKVYLAMIEASGGLPDRSVTISLKVIMGRTQLSCPTVIDGLARLEELGLVVSTTRQRGKVKTYYVADPPAHVPALKG